MLAEILGASQGSACTKQKDDKDCACVKKTAHEQPRRIVRTHRGTYEGQEHIVAIHTSPT